MSGGASFFFLTWDCNVSVTKVNSLSPSQKDSAGISQAVVVGASADTGAVFLLDVSRWDVTARETMRALGSDGSVEIRDSTKELKTNGLRTAPCVFRRERPQVALRLVAQSLVAFNAKHTGLLEQSTSAGNCDLEDIHHANMEVRAFVRKRKCTRLCAVCVQWTESQHFGTSFICAASNFCALRDVIQRTRIQHIGPTCNVRPCSACDMAADCVAHST